MISKPDRPKIYHILHVDRLPSIVSSGFLYSDAIVREQQLTGTTVGMAEIKDRRLNTPLSSYPNLMVGSCVPFYFCHRSIMLYLLHMGNHQGVTYNEGQQYIIHLVADALSVIDWANLNRIRWALTLSNAASSYFEDRNTIAGLDEINWQAVNARRWSGNGISREIREGKQAEFLIENSFPWQLVERIGVQTDTIGNQVTRSISKSSHRPIISIEHSWYY